MRVVAAMDSFKGSLSSIEAGNAVREGIRRVYRDAEVSVCPLADGGEGTVEALVDGMNGSVMKVKVTGPLGIPAESAYGVVENKKTALIDMAQAAGLTYVPKDQRNPLHTTTYGVGEMIKDAIGKGYRKFIIGIGGSATNDGGIGMLQALGYEFLNSEGKQVPFGAKGLLELKEIRMQNVLPELKDCTFQIACDVTNVLCGPSGCSAVYGPQKGADADIVITGEGRLDGQTAMGKAPVGAAQLARKYGKPVLAFAGSISADAKDCHMQGIDAFFPIVRGVVSLEEAMKPEAAKENLADSAEQVFRVWAAAEHRQEDKVCIRKKN